MELLRSIVLSVVSASFVLAILGGLLDEKGSASALLRLIGGVFLVLTILTPLTKMDFSGIDGYLESFSADGEDIAANGAACAENEYRTIIKERVEAYILDKAAAAGASLSVEVTLSDEDVPVPVWIRLSGEITPDAKGQLQQILEEELGIAKEDQIWIG